MASEGSSHPLTILTPKEESVVASSLIATLGSSPYPVPHKCLVANFGTWRPKFLAAVDDPAFLQRLGDNHGIRVHTPHGKDSWEAATWDMHRKTPLELLMQAPNGSRAMAGADLMRYDSRQSFSDSLLCRMADRHVMWLPHNAPPPTIAKERYHVVVLASSAEAKQRVLASARGFRTFTIFDPSPGETSTWCFYFGGCHWTSDEVHTVARKCHGDDVTMRLFATRASEAALDFGSTRPSEARVVMLQTLWVLRRWEHDPPRDLIAGFKRCEEIVQAMPVCSKERLQLEKALLVTRSTFANRVTFVAAKEGCVWPRGDIGTDGDAAAVLLDDVKGDWLQPRRVEALPPFRTFATLAQTEDELSRLKSNPKAPAWIFALVAGVGDAVRGSPSKAGGAHSSDDADDGDARWANESSKQRRRARKRRSDSKHNQGVRASERVNGLSPTGN